MAARHLSVALGCIGAALSVGAAACGSSSSTMTAPSPVKCAVISSNSPGSFGAEGGDGSLSIAAARECSWSVTADASWIAIAGDSAGRGDAVVNYHVAPNPLPSVRSGGFAVSGQRTEIRQDGAPCVFAVGATSLTFDARGGSFDVAVTTLTGCRWTAASDSAWITVKSGANGSASGSVGLNIAANQGGDRSGTVTIAGHAVRVVEKAADTASPAPSPSPSPSPSPAPPPPDASCSFSISPQGASLPSTGGLLPITVTTTTNCSWTVATQDSWVSIATGASGTGSGVVQLLVAPNTGSTTRGTTVTIAGQTFHADQAAGSSGCTYAIDPTHAELLSLGGTVAVSVFAPSACTWNASSNSDWIDVVSGNSGSGNGTVRLSVGLYVSLTARSGTVTIADQTFTVTQSGLLADQPQTAPAMTGPDR